MEYRSQISIMSRPKGNFDNYRYLSVKRSGRPLFVSSYSDNPKGSVLFLSNNQARLRSQIEKEYQSMHKKVNKTESTSKDLDF